MGSGTVANIVMDSLPAMQVSLGIWVASRQWSGEVSGTGTGAAWQGSAHSQSLHGLQVA